MFKKMTVLAMALGVVAAMVLPASASAVWKHGHTTPIAQNVQIGLTSTANVAFQSHPLGGGLNCQTTSTVDFFANQTTGAITTFKAHPTDATANCKGEGTLAFCQVHNLEATIPAEGWPIHTTGTAAAPTIQITNGIIHSQITGGFCPAGAVTVTAGTVVATPTPASGNTVTGVTLSGTASVHTPAGSDAAATVRGTLSVESPNSGTYSI